MILVGKRYLTVEVEGARQSLADFQGQHAWMMLNRIWKVLVCPKRMNEKQLFNDLFSKTTLAKLAPKSLNQSGF